MAAKKPSRIVSTARKLGIAMKKPSRIVSKARHSDF